MTPRERMKTAMDLGIPDRVPVMCQLSIGHMLLQLGESPVEFWYDGNTFADGLIQLRTIYDFDGILVSLHGHDPHWKEKIQSQDETSDGVIVTLKDGRSLIHPYNDLPRLLTAAFLPPESTALQAAALPTSLEYIPVSQGLRFFMNAQTRLDIFRIIRQQAGPEFSIHGEVTSPFDYYLDFMGYERGLIGLRDSPDNATRILSHFARLVSELASEMCDAGIDAVKVSSPFAGASFISPEMYREFVLPHEAKICRAVRAKNLHVYLHTCGSIGDRLELMFESGASGIECLDPPPLGNVDLEEAKRRTKGMGFIKGNIDSVHTLLAKDSAQILADARERLESGKRGGGFILSTACSVAPGVERHKLRLVREAADLWG